jgi:SulP family sulfate permease
MAATLVQGVPLAEGSERLFVTVMMVIMMTTALTGAVFFLLGTLKLGSLVRFLPYPVIGGFLAGTGWLLLKGALYVMADVPFDLAHLPDVFHASILVKWLPGVGFGVALLLISRRYRHFLIMPLTIIAGVGLFFLVLALTGTSIADAGVRGWLLGPFPRGALWQPFTPADAQHFQWSALTGQIGWNMGTIFLFGTISLLLNATGLELAVRRDVDVNRELVSAGIGNVLTGASGGIIGFHSLSCTALNHRIAPNSRLTGIFAAILCGITVFFGASMLSFFPKFLAGGLLFFLGLSFLVEWVYDAWRTLPKAEYALVLVILCIVGTVGFMEGVFAGLIMTVIIFVINYSRINVVKHTLTGSTFQSMVGRAVVDRRILQEKGEALVIFKLHGFIFFGTANALYQQLRERIIAPGPSAAQFLVLDFRLVTGLDSSALNSFTKLKQLAETQGVALVLTHLSPDIQRLFSRQGYIREGDQVVRVFRDVDAGVEWCEEQILMAEETANDTATHAQDNGELLESTFDDIMKSLEQQERFEVVVEELRPYLERQDRRAGEYLIRQGELPEALYFVESG